MKKIILGLFLLATTNSYGLTRGEVVSVVNENTLKVRDEKGKISIVELKCLDNKKISAKNKKKAQEFLAYKTNKKVILWESNQILVNGVEDLSLKALEWGILPLSKKCLNEDMVKSESLGKHRKTGIWSP